MPGLTLRAYPGESIENIAQIAQDIADRLERAVGFDFNSVRCVAQPGGSASKLEALYHDACGSQFVAYSNEIEISAERKWDA